MTKSIKIVREENLNRKMITRGMKQEQHDEIMFLPGIDAQSNMSYDSLSFNQSTDKLQEVLVYTEADLDLASIHNQLQATTAVPSNSATATVVVLNNKAVVSSIDNFGQSPSFGGVGAGGIVTRSRNKGQQQPPTTFVTVNSRNWSGGAAQLTDTAMEEDVKDFDLNNQPDFALIQERLDDPCGVQDDASSSSFGETFDRSGNNGGGRGGRRCVKRDEEELSPEEEEKRRVRRERNKLAAARCRKRRVDQTNDLQGQVDEWEFKKKQLQEEIMRLKNQQDDLKFILKAHNEVCSNGHKIKRPRSDDALAKSDDIQIDNFLTNLGMAAPAAPVPQSKPGFQPSPQSTQLNIPKVVVKSEPNVSLANDSYLVPVINSFDANSMSVNPSTTSTIQVTKPSSSWADNTSTISRQLTHQEALQPPVISDNSLAPFPAATSGYELTTAVTISPAGPSGSMFNVGDAVASSQSSRPSRPLSLAIKSNMMRSIEGIPIETPTNVVTNLNFDALMDGRTGLTPTNILTPVSFLTPGSASGGSLNTPTVVMTPSCGSQQRNSSQHHQTAAGMGAGNNVLLGGAGNLHSLMGDLTSPDNGSLKLVSL